MGRSQRRRAKERERKPTTRWRQYAELTAARNVSAARSAATAGAATREAAAERTAKESETAAERTAKEGGGAHSTPSATAARKQRFVALAAVRDPFLLRGAVTRSERVVVRPKL